MRTQLLLLVHVETVLNLQAGSAGSDRALSLTGNIHLPEVRAEIDFDGDKREGNGYAGERRATAVIIPRNLAMTIPPQRLSPPPSVRSDVWAWTPALAHDQPWMEHYAGRLDGEWFTFDLHVLVDATLDVVFTRVESANGGGAEVAFNGELRFAQPSHIRFQFRDPKQSSAPPSASECQEAVLIQAGARALIPRQSVTRLAGTHPWHAVRVVESGARVVCVEQPNGEPARSIS
jgi:hypothetical protein